MVRDRLWRLCQRYRRQVAVVLRYLSDLKDGELELDELRARLLRKDVGRQRLMRDGCSVVYEVVSVTGTRIEANRRGYNGRAKSDIRVKGGDASRTRRTRRTRKILGDHLEDETTWFEMQMNACTPQTNLIRLVSSSLSDTYVLDVRMGGHGMTLDREGVKYEKTYLTKLIHFASLLFY
jgi:hypothetical protein